MFEITTRDEGELTILAVQGEIDVGVTYELWSLMEGVMDRGRALKMHLAGVRYIDSSGIATLIRGLKYARKKNVDYALLSPSKRVRDVLELAHLAQLFSIEGGD